MIAQINTNEPKSTGIVVPVNASPDYVQIDITTGSRTYLSIINTHATEAILIAFGSSTPLAADYITLDTLASFEINSRSFFEDIAFFKVWFKASALATSAAVIIH